MLLLYPIAILIAVATDLFTFHYASTISDSDYDVEWQDDTFTFHYASTISELMCPNTRVTLTFTFHYASTISIIGTTGQEKRLALHSTMLLLYPTCRSKRPVEISLYIPLCFYYIGQSSGFAYIWCHFTFHYASTISIMASLQSSSELAFTFHYASTISHG